MANRKYPPRDDEGLLSAGEKFLENVGDPIEVGLTEDDKSRLDHAVTTGRTANTLHKNLQTQARNATQAKDDALETVEDILQEFNGRVQNHPKMTDAKRTALGLPIYDAVKSASLAPAEMPNVSINTATPLVHTIEFSREGGRGKPEGVKEIEIYFKLGGDASGDEQDYRYIGRDTESPYTKQFSAADSGKQSHYLCCWVNSKGERGPWKMISATVTSELQSGL
jgi:hypothetical protein